MILVVGATGLVGTRVCERLRVEEQPVRALVRKTSNPDKVNALRSLGCELGHRGSKRPSSDSGGLPGDISGDFHRVLNSFAPSGRLD
jgi:nucleoside-diphosphate-sugar epimerase